MDEKFKSKTLTNEVFCLCPHTGEYTISETEITHYRFPAANQFISIFCDEFLKAYPDNYLIVPTDVERFFPDIEIEMLDHRDCFNNMTPEDSLFFQKIRTTINADYFIYFERLGFGASDGSMPGSTIMTSKQSQMITQIWDINNKKLVARIISKGDDADIAGLLKDRSTRNAVARAVKNLLKQFPPKSN
ncbi:hypothetical protein KAR48_09270 [bacterium]|nr:hypothetical protein [bacterium]